MDFRKYFKNKVNGIPKFIHPQKNQIQYRDNNKKIFTFEMKIKNQDNAVFYNKYSLITVEIPKFNKAAKELKTMLDKWIYFFKNIDSFEKLPKLFKENIFKEAIEKTALANYTQIERNKYEKSLKEMRKEFNIIQISNCTKQFPNSISPRYSISTCFYNTRYNLNKIV